MARFERFEDTEGWHKAQQTVKAVYGAAADGAFARDFGLRHQIRLAVVSVLSNIAEGFKRGGNKAFWHFPAVAKASCGEIRGETPGNFCTNVRKVF